MKCTSRQPRPHCSYHLSSTTQTVEDSDGDGFATVTLDGSASFDPDGTIVSYQWHEGDTLLGNTAALQTDLAVGEHVLTLTMTDDDGLLATDTVVVTVKAATPDSPDPQITLTLPVGVHTIELTVTDDDGATAVDEVVITVEAPDAAPDPEPEAALTINTPSSVERGDRFDIRMTVMNTGATTLQNVSLNLSWSPSNRLRDVNNPNTVSLGDIAPGQSATFTWRARADRQGTVTISGTVTMNGTTLASGNRSMQIQK